jgi:hypothetical protein
MTPKLTCAALGAVALLALAVEAAAQPPPTPAPPSPLATRWERTPAPQEMRRIRPPEVLQQGGRAVIRCHVDAAGALSGCATVTESPAGSGYGQGLASLAGDFQMKPERVKTDAPDGVVTLTDSAFRFDAPPSWVRKPTPNDLVTVWPKSAWARHLGGRAVLTCLVSVQGALFDCVPLDESPVRENFGAAAIALTPQLLMKPAMLKGQAVVSQVNIPINFVMQPGGGGRGMGASDEGRQTVPAAMAWAAAPSFADMTAAYPAKAREAHLSGHVTVDCKFTRTGGLVGCTTIAEQPKGQGFGAAAHDLARQFRAPPELSVRTLGLSNVQVPFTFDAAVLTDTKPAIGKPQWAAVPSADETSAAFSGVTKAGVGGTVRVMLGCAVEPGGGVSDCRVTREEPAGQGVGEAALSLVPHFKMSTWTIEGLPTVGGSVNIPIRYEGKTSAVTPAAP